MARGRGTTNTKKKTERKVLKKKRKTYTKKGDKFGRQVAKELSLWWSDGLDEGVFRYIKGYDVLRGKVRKSKGMRTEEFGDITAADERGKPFSDNVVVEIKKGYGDWSFLDIIDRPGKGKQVFEYFWEQVANDVVNSGALRMPILIFRRDNRSSCICLEKNYLKILLLKEKKIIRTNVITFFSLRNVVVVMRLDYFLQTISPKAFQ